MSVIIFIGKDKILCRSHFTRQCGKKLWQVSFISEIYEVICSEKKNPINKNMVLFYIHKCATCRSLNSCGSFFFGTAINTRGKGNCCT